MTDTEKKSLKEGKSFEQLVEDFEEAACCYGAAGVGRARSDAEADLRDARVKLLRSFSEASNRTCEWAPEGSDALGWWISGCGKEFVLDDDENDHNSPRDWMKFCPFCGGKAAFAPLPEAPKEGR